MTWLIGQVWPFLLVSALAGAALTFVLSTRRVEVTRWVEVPVEPSAEADLTPGQDEVADGVPEVVPAPAPSSPFPVLLGQPDARPWEEEELWSRPVRKVAATTVQNAREDEWDDAADNWREWAAAAKGESPVSDADLFSREIAEDAVGPVPGSPFPAMTADDPFPYARPVEADRP